MIPTAAARPATNRLAARAVGTDRRRRDHATPPEPAAWRWSRRATATPPRDNRRASRTPPERGDLILCRRASRDGRPPPCGCGLELAEHEGIPVLARAGGGVAVQAREPMSGPTGPGSPVSGNSGERDLAGAAFAPGSPWPCVPSGTPRRTASVRPSPAAGPRRPGARGPGTWPGMRPRRRGCPEGPFGRRPRPSGHIAGRWPRRRYSRPAMNRSSNCPSVIPPIAPASNRACMSGIGVLNGFCARSGGLHDDRVRIDLQRSDYPASGISYTSF